MFQALINGYCTYVLYHQFLTAILRFHRIKVCCTVFSCIMFTARIVEFLVNVGCKQMLPRQMYSETREGLGLTKAAESLSCQ